MSSWDSTPYMHRLQDKMKQDKVQGAASADAGVAHSLAKQAHSLAKEQSLDSTVQRKQSSSSSGGELELPPRVFEPEIPDAPRVPAAPKVCADREGGECKCKGNVYYGLKFVNGTDWG